MNGNNPIKFLLVFALTVALFYHSKGQAKDSLPKPVGYVNDFENIFSAQEERYLDSMILDFEKQTTTQFAVITIDTSMVNLNDFNDYVVRIANAWGTGQKEKNNGVVIGFSKAYRRIRIVNGYGIEPLMSDSETKTIIDTAFIPYFKKGQYFEGVINGLRAIMSKLQ